MSSLFMVLAGLPVWLLAASLLLFVFAVSIVANGAARIVGRMLRG